MNQSAEIIDIDVESYQRRYYSSRLRCHFCRRSGHRDENCPTYLLSRLYTCIQHERDHEVICFLIIRNFSISEMLILFKAIHEERNIQYQPIALTQSFIQLVPVIVSIILQDEEEERREEEEIINNIDLDVIENIQYPSNQEPSNQESPESVEEPPEMHALQSFPIPTASGEEEETQFQMQEEGQIWNFEQERMEVDAYALNFEQETYALMNETFDQEEEDFWPLPPLLDSSGNIISNTEDTPVPQAPEIQITLNQKIKIIPTRESNVLDEDLNNESRCPICFQDFEQNKTIKTDCNHCFCFNCIKTHTKMNVSCPLCRVDILKLNVHMENLV